MKRTYVHAESGSQINLEQTEALQLRLQLI